MSPKPRFILPNRLSVLRMFIGLGLPVLLIKGSGNLAVEILAFFLFLFGAFTDYWDGWIARRHHLETPLGKILDPTADKVLILGTLASFSALGLYPYWFLVPVFIREIAVTVCRMIWIQEGQAVGAERAGKVKLCLQAAWGTSAFLYLFWKNELTFFLLYFFLLASLVLTLYSGFFFFKHNVSLLENKKFLHSLCSLGVGHLKPAPGTLGTLLGLGTVLIVGRDLLLHTLVFFLAWGVAYWAIGKLGLGPAEDPPEIVIDEYLGILLAFLTLPLNLGTVIGGFILFRLFDITKVFPLNWLEKRPGTQGILLDDLGAGCYTWLVLKIFFPAS